MCLPKSALCMIQRGKSHQSQCGQFLPLNVQQWSLYVCEAVARGQWALKDGISLLWTCRRRTGAEGFEDGTAHFLGLAAVRHGFAAIASVGGFPAIHQHTQMVTRYLQPFHAHTFSLLGQIVTSRTDASGICCGHPT